ncbi:hypothetical protein H8K35_14895 [Undibacterium sp. LX40W]|uniref:Uncharacterized protein n=1 Tax=Undibacterium nitidum TaxID=2762298 RepID=A0A923KUZ4_9BURK|nr:MULTISPECIES: hypothetical protein [Undibacterium]MBC3882677.1 hypothetical protein [Undibacterium nitidum]MBC3892958.1 hypothetical protein [Undibacterium sp. LX40W]
MTEENQAEKNTKVPFDKNPNNVAEILNRMSTIDEVREWIKHEPFGIWDEYPRGRALLSMLLRGMANCKYGHELTEDIQDLENRWRDGLG